MTLQNSNWETMKTTDGVRCLISLQMKILKLKIGYYCLLKSILSKEKLWMGFKKNFSILFKLMFNMGETWIRKLSLDHLIRDKKKVLLILKLVKKLLKKSFNKKKIKINYSFNSLNKFHYLKLLNKHKMVKIIFSKWLIRFLIYYF